MTTASQRRLPPRNQTRRRRAVAALHARQDGRCWYCGRPCQLPASGQHAQAPDTATLEHLTRAARVMACYDCNQAKGQWSDTLARNAA